MCSAEGDVADPVGLSVLTADAASILVNAWMQNYRRKTELEVSVALEATAAMGVEECLSAIGGKRKGRSGPSDPRR